MRNRIINIIYVLMMICILATICMIDGSIPAACISTGLCALLAVIAYRMGMYHDDD
jgi:uncharacterized MnhB-related membrane protein